MTKKELLEENKKLKKGLNNALYTLWSIGIGLKTGYIKAEELYKNEKEWRELVMKDD